MKKTRILVVMTILAVMFTAVPAFAGHPRVARRVVNRHFWPVPVHVPPPVVHRHYHPPLYVPPPVVHRHYHPPLYMPPPVVRHYMPPRPGYWVPGRYYYDSDPGVEVGVYRGGFGLHIDF